MTAQSHYDSLAKRQGVLFDLHCSLPGECAVADADFSALLCNLIENALEACGRMTSGERFIRVGIALMGSALNIRVSNSAAAGAAALGGNRFASSKAEGRIGYGLYSVRMIARKYGGQSETAWDEAHGVFTHSVTLFLQ